MKRSALAISVCLAVWTSGALAYDFAIKGRFNQTFDGSDNYFLSNAPSGATYRSLSALNLDFLAQTPTTQYLLDTNLSYYKYFGPGAANLTQTWGTPANATFRIDHTTELSKYNFSASWSRADTATTTLAQTGVATGRGTTDSYNVNAGVTRDLSRVDSVSWSTSASTVSSTDANFTPYLDVTSAINWNHSLTQTTGLTNLISFDWFSQDDAANTQRLLWRFMTGLNSKLTPRLSVNGNVGLIFSNAYQNSAIQTVVSPTPTGPLAFTPTLGAGHGVVWDAGLSYQLLKTTSVSLNVADTIIPTLTGQLQKSETLGLSLSHEINHVSNVSFFTQVAQTTSGAAVFSSATASSAAASNSDFFTASVNYGYRLTRELNANLSYSYHQRSDTSGTARASIVLLSLNYDFNVLGNPTPINIAERERARERARDTVGYVFPNFH